MMWLARLLRQEVVETVVMVR
jgi:TAG lipase / steryl ester hydrolase / phospholipase A2 / LPA acyltransferase